MKNITVAITGASGTIYGKKLIEVLLSLEYSVDLIFSPSAKKVMAHELNIDNENDFIDSLNVTDKKGITLHKYDDLLSKLASGSALKKQMVICPSSMGTIGRIAGGISGNLIERAADCVLKERGDLIIVPRETPFNLIHLENMTRLTQAGAVIVPAMVAFYTLPKSIDDMVDFVVGKVLDTLSIEHNLFKRWQS